MLWGSEQPTAPTTNDDDDDEEVRKLKVCIELKGLRLRKPTSSSPERPEVKEERTWSSHHSPSFLPRTLPPTPTWSPAHAPPPRDRKFKVDPEVKPLSQKPEITKSWAREMLANGDAKRGSLSVRLSCLILIDSVGLSCSLVASGSGLLLLLCTVWSSVYCAIRCSISFVVSFVSPQHLLSDRSVEATDRSSSRLSMV